MPRAELLITDNKLTEQVWIYCPGCKGYHAFTIKAPNFSPWTWNSNLDRPTFSQSLLCNKDYPELRCHSFVTDGRIQYLSDCYHELKNQTVDLPEIDLSQWNKNE